MVPSEGGKGDINKPGWHLEPEHAGDLPVHPNQLSFHPIQEEKEMQSPWLLGWRVTVKKLTAGLNTDQSLCCWADPCPAALLMAGSLPSTQPAPPAVSLEHRYLQVHLQPGSRAGPANLNLSTSGAGIPLPSFIYKGPTMRQLLPTLEASCGTKLQCPLVPTVNFSSPGRGLRPGAGCHFSELLGWEPCPNSSHSAGR